MRRTKILPIAAALVLAAALPAVAARTKKVAVIGFDDSAVRAGAGKIFGQDVDVGRSLSAQVAEYLAIDATYRIIDRAKIDKARAKSRFAALDLSDPAAVSAFGRAIKADAVLVGRIATFGKHTRRSRRRGSRKMLTRAIVVIEIQLIETRKGKVLLKGAITGESTRSGRVLLTSPTFKGFGDGGADLARTDFHTTPLGQAVMTSVERVSERVIGAKDDLGVKQFSVTATIASVTGPEARLNLGAGMGLKVGDQLAVRRVVGEEKKSGVLLSRRTRRVAVIEIVALDDLSTTARVVSGGAVQVGDEVRIVMN